MLQQMAELPLDQNLHLFDYWADQFEQLPIYFMTFHGQQSIKVVMEVIFLFLIQRTAYSKLKMPKKLRNDFN